MAEGMGRQEPPSRWELVRDIVAGGTRMSRVFWRSAFLITDWYALDTIAQVPGNLVPLLVRGRPSQDQGFL